MSNWRDNLPEEVIEVRFFCLRKDGKYIEVVDELEPLEPAEVPI